MYWFIHTDTEVNAHTYTLTQNPPAVMYVNVYLIFRQIKEKDNRSKWKKTIICCNPK
jgi:hypothetical protein